MSDSAMVEPAATIHPIPVPPPRSGDGQMTWLSRAWLVRVLIALTVPAAIVGWAEVRFGSIRVALAAARGAPVYVVCRRAASVRRQPQGRRQVHSLLPGLESDTAARTSPVRPGGLALPSKRAVLAWFRLGTHFAPELLSLPPPHRGHEVQRPILEGSPGIEPVVPGARETTLA